MYQTRGRSQHSLQRTFHYQYWRGRTEPAYSELTKTINHVCVCVCACVCVSVYVRVCKLLSITQNPQSSHYPHRLSIYIGINTVFVAMMNKSRPSDWGDGPVLGGISVIRPG